MPKSTDSFRSVEINKNLRKNGPVRRPGPVGVFFRINHWYTLAYAFTVVEHILNMSVYIYFLNL